MAIVPIVDIPTADGYNVLRQDWLSLSNSVKTQHIWNASLYIQTHWTCVDVDWDDDTTWPDDLKRACSYYAYADSLGVLYDGSFGTEAPTAKVIEETRKISTLVKTTRWAETGAITSGDPLGQIDNIMLTICTRTGAGGGVQVVRV